MNGGGDLSFFPELIGSETMRIRVGETIRRRRFSHAYLIEGRSGSGRRTFARMIAAALSCEAREDESSPLPCGICPACRKILSGNAPDVRFIERGDRAGISVETIRDLRAEMALSSTELDTRVYIICDADTMTPAAQNALLISLEEPPADVLLLLLCESSQLLLPTIRSRAQLLRMGYVSAQKVEQTLLAHVPEARKLKSYSPEKLAAVISAADGCIGTAEKLLKPKSEAELFRTRQTVSETAAVFARARSYAEVYTAVSSLPTKRNELSAVLSVLCDAIRDLCLLRREPSLPLLFFTDRSAAAALAEGADLRRLFRVSDALRRAQDDLAANANVQMILTMLASSVCSRS